VAASMNLPRVAVEPELAPSGWHCPHRRLTLMMPFGDGNGRLYAAPGGALRVHVCETCIGKPIADACSVTCNNGAMVL
jgi:hypothetical protein